MAEITHLDAFRRERGSPAARAWARPPEDRHARAQHYRERAEELRAISEDVMLRETRLTLLSLAESYEQMARAMAKIEARLTHS